jgi:hypothetical protein
MGSPNGHTDGAVPATTDTREAIPYGALLTRQIEPLRPLVAGLIDEETGSILAGPPNVGKTWLILTLARAVGSGTAWLGHFPTTPASFLIFDEEGHLPGTQARCRMLEAADPLDPAPAIHFCIGHGARLDTQVGIDHTEAMIRAHQPGLTIMDSLTRVHGADENDAGAMASVFAVAKTLMRAYGTAFLFTDHLRKKSLINDPEEMLRGSTEKRACPDSILFVAPADKQQLEISHIKSRHGKRHDPFAVDLVADEEAGTATLTYAGSVTSSAVTKGNEIVTAIQALKEQLGEDGADATTVAAWLDCHPDTVRRHVAKLVAAGILVTRKVAPGEKGGKPKDVYDMLGGRE